jgi:outer membrane murein-binding lipoprotein Lpp
MRRYLCKETKWFLVLIIALFVAGCAPGPPPIPPGLFGAGFGWLMVGLLVWGAILLWKNLNSTKTTKTDHLADALNAINERLTALEEKMEQSEKDKK